MKATKKVAGTGAAYRTRAFALRRKALKSGLQREPEEDSGFKPLTRSKYLIMCAYQSIECARQTHTRTHSHNIYHSGVLVG